jgi:uncharacterized membrane protein HdeD (DUF308 family)
MPTPLMRATRSSAGWSIAVSVLMIVAGLLAIGLPQVAGIAVDVLVAWVVLVSGAAHLAFAWHTRTRGGVAWQSLLGVVYFATGLYLLVRPVAGLASLTLALAIYLFVKGVLEFILSFQLRPSRGAGWLLIDGIVTFILAAMIWSTWPWNTVWVIGTLVGVSIFFSGITRLMLSLAFRKTLG